MCDDPYDALDRQQREQERMAENGMPEECPACGSENLSTWDMGVHWFCEDCDHGLREAREHYWSVHPIEMYKRNRMPLAHRTNEQVQTMVQRAVRAAMRQGTGLDIIAQWVQDAGMDEVRGEMRAMDEEG